MSSVYNSNLEHLMKVMNLSSRNLSEQLNVHYSLVSKWLNGKRPLKQNSTYMKQIVEIMLNLDHHNHFSVIKKILSEYYPTERINSRESVALYLSYYLSANESSVNSVTQWDAVDNSKISARCKLDLYTNTSGRQHAIVRLLDSALSLPAGQDILIYGRESVTWRNAKNSMDFHALLKSKHQKVINKGDKITIIHSIDRDDEELIQNLLYWLPLHLTRKTNALYIPEYAGSPIKASMTILRNKAAMFGMTADGQSSSLSTYYSTDVPILEKLQEYFSALSLISIPLFENNDISETTALSLDLSARRGNSFMCSALPFQYCFNRREALELFEENNIKDTVLTSCLDFFELDKKRLISSLDSRKTTLFMSLSQLEKAVTEGVNISYCNWITGRPLYVSPRMVHTFCRNFCDIILDIPNLSIAMINNIYLQDSTTPTLLVKENYAFLANAISYDVLGPLIVKEPTIVRAVYQYMEKIWRSTPRIYKDKGSIVQLIYDIM